MPVPPHLSPFVLDVEPVTPQRHGNVDFYLPKADQPGPAVVFVHGGPVPAAVRPTPRDWPVYQGYGALAAADGLVGVTVDHRLHDPTAYPVAAGDVAAAAEEARAHPQVDGERVAVWFFSGSCLLLADWLHAPPPWLRCVAATYPFLTPWPGWPVESRFRPVEAVADAGTLPIVLTRVGLEQPVVAAGVEEFVAAARAGGARLEIIDVPDGQHGFDHLDHTDQSRRAVRRGMDAVLAALA